MEALAHNLEEFCPLCGGWVSASTFNYNKGFCVECTTSISEPGCTRCGEPVQQRTMCKSCTMEVWYERHGDEVEFLVVTKGYSVAQAREIVRKMIRPTCNCCGSVIQWGTPGETLFCKANKRCHAMYGKYKRLVRKGMSPSAAMTQLRHKDEREVTYSGRLIAVPSVSTC
jgi:hypothetical protein